jgi:uncharacterized protein YoxC
MDTTLVAAMWQGTITEGDGHKLMIFAGIAAVSLAFVALVLLGVIIAAVGAQKKVAADIAELKAKVFPAIAKSEALMAQVSGITADLTPKIRDISAKVESIAGHAEEISAMLKDKVVEFGPTLSAANETVLQANETVRQANVKTQQQVVRVNGMVTSVLDATAQMGRAIQHGINVPVREVSGLLDGVKAGLASFLNGKPKSRPPVYRAPIGTYKPDGED